MIFRQKKQKLSKDTQYLVHRAKALIKDLAAINPEIAQTVVTEEDGKSLPEWFLIEVVRDLPNLIAKGA